MNKRSYSHPKLLQIKKNQQSCERGFVCLKDPLLFADKFFV
ncbi:hypothetical protein RintRC_4969 [Richelia intracellularis]|nr:hypothetical protein RintRC_4969 [Richelia intracellularis]